MLLIDGVYRRLTTKSSRVCLGVYSSEEKVIEAAKKNDLYTHQAEVVILECDIDNFSEL